MEVYTLLFRSLTDSAQFDLTFFKEFLKWGESYVYRHRGWFNPNPSSDPYPNLNPNPKPFPSFP